MAERRVCIDDSEMIQVGKKWRFRVMKLSKANICAGGYCAFFLVRRGIRKNERPNFASVRTESFQVDLGDCSADVLRERSEWHG
jgi:hypothetical protein